MPQKQEISYFYDKLTLKNVTVWKVLIVVTEIDLNVLFEGLSEFYTEFQLIVYPSGRLRS